MSALITRWRSVATACRLRLAPSLPPPAHRWTTPPDLTRNAVAWASQPLASRPASLIHARRYAHQAQVPKANGVDPSPNTAHLAQQSPRCSVANVPRPVSFGSGNLRLYHLTRALAVAEGSLEVACQEIGKKWPPGAPVDLGELHMWVLALHQTEKRNELLERFTTTKSSLASFFLAIQQDERIMTSDPAERILVLLEFWLTCKNRKFACLAKIPMRLTPTTDQRDRLAHLRARSEPCDTIAIAQAYASFGDVDALAMLSRSLSQSQLEALIGALTNSDPNAGDLVSACRPSTSHPATSNPTSLPTPGYSAAPLVEEATSADTLVKIKALISRHAAPNGDAILRNSTSNPTAAMKYEALKQLYSPSLPPVASVLSQVVLHSVPSLTPGAVYVWVHLLANLNLTDSDWEQLCAHESLMQPVTQMTFQVRDCLSDELHRLTICLYFWCKGQHFGTRTQKWAINELKRLRSNDPRSPCWPNIHDIVSTCTIYPDFSQRASHILSGSTSYTAKDILDKLSLPTAPSKDPAVVKAVSLPKSVEAYNGLVTRYAPDGPPRTEIYKQVVAQRVCFTPGSAFVWVQLLANGHLTEAEWAEMCNVRGSLRRLTLQLFESRAHLSCPVHRIAVMLPFWLEHRHLGAKLKIWALKQLGHYAMDHPHSSAWPDIRIAFLNCKYHKDFCASALTVLTPLQDALDPLQQSLSALEPVAPNPAAADQPSPTTTTASPPPVPPATGDSALTLAVSPRKSAPVVVATPPAAARVASADDPFPTTASPSQPALLRSNSPEPSLPSVSSPSEPASVPASFPPPPIPPASGLALATQVAAPVAPDCEHNPADTSEQSSAESVSNPAQSTLLSIESRAPVPSKYFKRLVAFDKDQRAYTRHCRAAGKSSLRGAAFVEYLSFLADKNLVTPLHPPAVIVWVRWFSEMQFSDAEWEEIFKLPESKFTAANKIIHDNRYRLPDRHWIAVIALQATLAYGNPSSELFAEWILSELDHATSHQDWPLVRAVVTKLIDQRGRRAHELLMSNLKEFFESPKTETTAASSEDAKLKPSGQESATPDAAVDNSSAVFAPTSGSTVADPPVVPAALAPAPNPQPQPTGAHLAAVVDPVRPADMSRICYCIHILPSVDDSIATDFRDLITAIYLEMINSEPKILGKGTVAQVPKQAVGNETVGSAIVALLELHPIVTKRQKRLVSTVLPRVKSITLSETLVRMCPPTIDLKPFQSIVNFACLQGVDWSFIPYSFAPAGKNVLRDALLSRESESVALLKLLDHGMSPTSVSFLIELSKVLSHSRRCKDPHIYYQWCQLLFASKPSESEWHELLKLPSPFLRAVETAYQRRAQLDLYPVQFLIIYEVWLKVNIQFSGQMLSYLAETATRFYRHPGLIDAMDKSFNEHGRMSSSSQSLAIARVFANARATERLVPILEKHPWVAVPVLQETMYPSPDLIQLLVSTIRSSVDLHLPVRDSRVMARVLYGLSCLGPAASDLVFFVVTMLRNQNAPFTPFMCTSVLRSLATVAVERKSVMQAMVHFYHEMKTQHNAVAWSAFHHLLTAHLHHQDRRGALFFFVERHNYLVQHRDAERVIAATHQPTSTLAADIPPELAASAESAVADDGEDLPSDSDPGAEPDVVKSTIGMDPETAAKTAHLPFGSLTRFVYRDKRAEQLLALLAESRDYGEAVKFYDFLRAQGYPINERMLEIMADAYVGTRNFNARASEFSGMLVDIGYANLFLLMAVGGGTLYLNHKERQVVESKDPGSLDAEEDDDDGDDDADQVDLGDNAGLLELHGGPRDAQLFKQAPDTAVTTAPVHATGSVAPAPSAESQLAASVHSLTARRASDVPLLSPSLGLDSQYPALSDHDSAAGDLPVSSPDHVPPPDVEIAAQGPSTNADADSGKPDWSLVAISVAVDTDLGGGSRTGDG